MEGYPSLLNLSNFIALDSYEAKFDSSEATVSGLAEQVARLAECDAQSQYLDTYLTIAAYCKQVVLNPAAAAAALNLRDILKLWEVRMNCLLMAAGLKDKHGNVPVPNSKYLRTEVDLLQKELERLSEAALPATATSSGSTPSADTSSGSSSKFPDEVSWNFQNLLTRIRYTNTILVLHAYYSEIFRQRGIVGAGGNDVVEAKQRIYGLLFSICGLLAARQEYLTLFNETRDCSCVDTSDGSHDNGIGAQVATLCSAAGLKLVISDDPTQSPYYIDVEDAYSKATPESLEALAKLASDDETTIGSLQDLADLRTRISPQTLYSLAGTYELPYMLQEVEKETQLKHSPQELDAALKTVYETWPKRISNIYAFE